MRLDGRVAIETGASRGIGGAVADPTARTGQNLWSEGVLHPELGTHGWLRD